MKKRALLSLALILALLAALYLWYTRPRSFLAITGTSENAVCFRRPASVRVLGG